MTSTEIPNTPHSKKRRSSLTLVILAVNIIPLLIMGFGIFYLDKYKQNLIESAYGNLEEQSMIISLGVEENITNFEKLTVNWPKGKTVLLIDNRGQIIDTVGNFWEEQNQQSDKAELQSFTETFASIFLYLNPLQTSLPSFPILESPGMLNNLPEVQEALTGKIDLSAWAFADSFILTATMPTYMPDGSTYVVMIIAAGDQITTAINEVRKDIIQAFIIVIILTFLLSVYLSSFIAIPLKKLGRAAEDIRRGKRNLTDLPDMSKRKDEIGELSIILRQMTMALDARIDAIQNFAADVSHEIKNPITSIRSAVETALVLDDKEQRDGLLRIMEQDVHRLDRLITDISRHSRMDTELARDNYKVVDLKEILNDISDLWRTPIERNSAEEGPSETYQRIKTSFPEEPCIVLGKGNSLGQVFQNLLANAISFHKSDQPVDLIMTKKEDDIIITIEDRGPGIPDGQLDKIFERFYSDRPQDHDTAQNSGLGLSIAKQIIDSHNGKIFAENIKDDQNKVIGARFNVILSAFEET